jgi:NitT/TauT family transport system substrate-binding protein
MQYTRARPGDGWSAASCTEELGVSSRAKLWSLHLALVLSLLTVACRPGTSPGATVPEPAPRAEASPAPTAPPAAPVALSVGVLGSLVDLPVFIAVDRGYFTEEGLGVRLAEFNSAANMIPLLTTDQLHLGSGGVNVGIFNAIGRGVKLRIVADKQFFPAGYQGSGFLVRTDLLESGRVREARDLRGLTIAQGAQGTTQEVQLDALLQEGGLSYDDVVLKLVPYADQAAALANGSIDVTSTFEPYTTTFQERGLARMWRLTGDITPDNEASVVLFGPKLVDELRDAGNRWMVAYLRGVRAYTQAFAAGEPPDDVVQSMVTHGSIKDPALIRRVKAPVINPDGYPFKESLQKTLDFFVRRGLVTTPPNLDEVIDTSFVDYAIGRLGRYRP